MSEQPSNTDEDELAFLRPAYTEAAKATVNEMTLQESGKQGETAQTEPETDSDTRALKDFVGELEKRLATVDEEKVVGSVAGYTQESRRETVSKPGALRVRSWHNEEDGTDVTRVLFGAKGEMELIDNGYIELTSTRDIAGELIKLETGVSYPSVFRKSFGDYADWEAGKGFDGSHRGGESMSPEEAQVAVSGVLGRFDELLGEAGL